MPVQDLNGAIRSAIGPFSDAGAQISESEMKNILAIASAQDARPTGGILERGAAYTLTAIAGARMQPGARDLYDTFMRGSRLEGSRVAATEARGPAPSEKRTELRASKKV